MKLSYPLAVILSRIAADRAEAMGVPMVIALSDEQGELIHYSRMDGALPASSTIAVNKAYTSAALRMATHEVGRLSQPGEALYGIQHTLEGRAVLFGGGFPLRWDDTTLGAVGISGGSVDQDVEVAKPVLEAWDRMVAVARALAPALPREILDPVQAPMEVLEALKAAISQNSEVYPRDWEMILTGSFWLIR